MKIVGKSPVKTNIWPSQDFDLIGKCPSTSLDNKEGK